MGSTPKNLAIVVIIPPMTILPLVLAVALFNYLAKHEPGLSWTPSSIEDKKYNLDKLGTLRLLSRAKKQQAKIC